MLYSTGSTEDIKFENNQYLEELNLNFNPGATKYYVAIGTKPVDIPVLGPISSYYKFLPGPDDGAVTVKSAKLPGVSRYCAEDNHLSVSKSRTVYTSIIIPILSGQQPTPIGPCPTEDPNDNQVIPIILEGIHVNLRTGEMYVDFFLVSINLLRYWIGFRERDCDFDFRLISPSGDVIDPDVAANDPNISYVANETEGNDHYWYYIINNPEPGIWQYNITALEVPEDGVDIEIFNIFSNATPPEITFFAPPSPVNDTVCNWRTFNVTVNQKVNVSWYLNNTLQHTNVSTKEASYTLHAEFVGEHNVSAKAKNENGTDMQTWIWNVTEESSYTFELFTGWNMISFPVDPLDKNADTIFGPEYYYLCTWDPNTGCYVPIDAVETEIGYWLLVLEDRSVTVLGIPLSEYNTSMTQGWNMIGSLWTATNVPGGTETVPADQMYPHFYTWCKDHYALTQDIDPGLGYWALAYIDCELHVFPAPSAAPLPVQQITWGDNDWRVRLALTSGAGTDVAEFGLHEDATDDFSAKLDVPEPPSPPPASTSPYLQVYFYDPENPVVKKLSTCYIPHYFDDDDEEYNSWLFRLEYSGDASDVTITWNAEDITAVPAEYSLLFIVDGEQIDMRTTPSYTFRAKTGTYEFEIRAITGVKKPDLVIEEEYEKGKAGSYIVFFVVKNIGTATAPEGHYATLYVDGMEKDKKLVPTDLEPGETYKGSFKTKVGLTGKVENIMVCADSYNDVDELDEANNCLKGRWQHVEEPTTDKPPTDKLPADKLPTDELPTKKEAGLGD